MKTGLSGLTKLEPGATPNFYSKSGTKSGCRDRRPLKIEHKRMALFLFVAYHSWMSKFSWFVRFINDRHVNRGYFEDQDFKCANRYVSFF